MRARGHGYGFLPFAAACLVVLWILLLGGCASSTRRDRAERAFAGVGRTEAVEVREIPVYVVHDLGVWYTAGRIRAWGVTTGSGTEAWQVELDDSMPEFGHVAPMVAAHEFGHVLGVECHNPDCPWMQPGMPTETPLVDCPCEDTIVKARARSWKERYVLRLVPTTDQAFIEATRWAVKRWNAVLGRNALSMRIGYAPATTADGGE